MYFFVLFFCVFYLWSCVFFSLSAGRQPTWAGSTVRSSQHLLLARHCWLFFLPISYFVKNHRLSCIASQHWCPFNQKLTGPYLLLYVCHRKIKLSQEQEKSWTGFAPDLINSRQCIERDTLRKGRKNDGKKSRSPIVGNHNFSAPIAEQSACWKNTEIPVHVRFHRTRSIPLVSIVSGYLSPSQKPMSSRLMDLAQQMM